MARTYRKTLSYEHPRGRFGKRKANKNFRRVSKEKLKNYNDGTIFPLIREVSCVWDWRDYKSVYFDSLHALKKEWWIKNKWWKWTFK